MDLEQIQALDAKYYMPVFGERFPVAFTHGKGMVLYDTAGKAYRDFLGGIAVNCLGYGDEELTAVLQEQVGRLLHSSNYFYNETQALAAQKLAQATGLDRVFFANSGAEAIEGCLKLARKYFYNRGESRYQVITMQNSFHGRTLATLSATGQQHFQKPFYPLMPKFVHVPYNDLAAVRQAMTDKTCAVLVEPILGEGGVIPAQPDFLKGLRQLTQEKGVLLIADEIQTGLGRTGSFLACQKYGVEPDIVALAKALGGGVPIGAFCAQEEVASAFAPGDHGTTFGGNHLATAAACHVLSRLAETDLLAHVREMGQYLQTGLQSLVRTYPKIALQARGMGLMQALVLAPELPAKACLKALLKMGYVAGSAGGNALRFVPPYILEKEDIDGLLAALTHVFEKKGSV